MRIETQVIHAGAPSPRIGGAAVVPIFQSSVFEHQEGATYDELRYPRLSTLPNHDVLHGRIAALEGTDDAIVTASGMAAISTTIFAAVGQGGHLLVQKSLYGGTHSFVTDDLEAFGITYDFIDPERPEEWASKVRADTRVVYTEALSNPLLEVIDHPAVVSFARERGLATLIDATFATPVNFRPAELGYDLVLHSCTKYFNGHSDLAAGAVAGSASWIGRVRRMLNHLGGSLDPHACFLLERGLKTLVLRVERQNENAQAMAEFLGRQGAVSRVNYPGLPEHPHHERSRELMTGFGGVLSFELAGGAAAADRLMDRLEIPLHGPSLGGVETLITRPATSSHRSMPDEVRRAAGISDGLVRLSVGVECIEDLVDDFQAALS